MMIQQKIVICGPTCSGKSALAVQIAQKIGAVIINADSQQVYSDLQILSARPTPEEMQDVPHYLYGVLPAEKICNTGIWLEMARAAIKQIGDRPIIFVGGTGLYFKALFNGIAAIPEIPPEIRNQVRQMDLAKISELLGAEADGNPQRMMRALEVKLATGISIKKWHKMTQNDPFLTENFTILTQITPRETLYNKINQRLIRQVQSGALKETSQLMQKNLDYSYPCMKAHGVPEFIRHLRGELSLEQAIEKAQQNVRNYAKRQQTWFTHQLPPHKIEITSDAEALKCFT